MEPRQTGHRPPVSLDELERGKEDKKPQYQKRRLSYIEPGKKNGGGGNTQKFTLVALAVLISLSLSLLLFSRKSDVEVLVNNQKVLETRLGDLGAEVDANKERINNVINNYALKSDLSNYALRSDLDNYVTIDQLPNPTYCSLVGTTGNYTLDVGVSKPGSYLARISLVYLVPYSLNTTTLEESYRAFSGNWTGQNFIPKFRFEGSSYKVLEAYFYTGVFSITGASWRGSIGSFSAPPGYTISAEVLSVP